MVKRLGSTDSQLPPLEYHLRLGLSNSLPRHLLPPPLHGALLITKHLLFISHSLSIVLKSISTSD